MWRVDVSYDCGIWVLIAACLIGVGSPWVGVVYGAGFLFPLLYALRIGFAGDASERVRRTLTKNIVHARRLSWMLSVAVALFLWVAPG